MSSFDDKFDDLRMCEKGIQDAMNEAYRGEFTIRKVTKDINERENLAKDQDLIDFCKDFCEAVSMQVLDETSNFLMQLEDVYDDYEGAEDLIEDRVQSTLNDINTFLKVLKQDIKCFNSDWQEHLLNVKKSKSPFKSSIRKEDFSQSPFINKTIHLEFVTNDDFEEDEEDEEDY